VLFFVVGGVVLAIGNSMTDYFAGDMKPILIWGGAALVVGLVVSVVYYYASEKYLAGVIGVMGGVVMTTFILGMFGAPVWLNAIVMVIVCSITGYLGVKYDDDIKRIGTSGLGAFMIVYGIASFFDAMPSLSAGTDQQFKIVYVIDIVVWLLLFGIGYKVQVATKAEASDVFDDDYNAADKANEPAAATGVEKFVGFYVCTNYVALSDDQEVTDGVNSWHFVEISEEDNELVWTNAAEKSWNLMYEEGTLTTKENCPYDVKELSIGEDGTLMFLDEPYTPVDEEKFNELKEALLTNDEPAADDY
jgi:hypothetical protein